LRRRGERPTPRARRSPAQDVHGWVGRPGRSRIHDRLRPLLDGRLLLPRWWGRCRGEGHRQITVWVDVLAEVFLHQGVVVADLEDRHPARGPGTRITATLGHWRRLVVEDVRLGDSAGFDGRPRRPHPAQAQVPAVDPLTGFPEPVAFDEGTVDDEYVACLRPLLHRLHEPREVPPPERLVLAPVVVERSG